MQQKVGAIAKHWNKLSFSCHRNSQYQYKPTSTANENEEISKEIMKFKSTANTIANLWSIK